MQAISAIPLNSIRQTVGVADGCGQRKDETLQIDKIGKLHAVSRVLPGNRQSRAPVSRGSRLLDHLRSVTQP